MSLFIDTSALYALLDGDEPRHADVAAAWRTVTDNGRVLFTSNYVLVETFALVQRRLGFEAVRGLADAFVPLLQPVWVDEQLHAAAVASLFTAAQRHLSLVDCASFEIMRRLVSAPVPRRRIATTADFIQLAYANGSGRPSPKVSRSMRGAACPRRRNSSLMDPCRLLARRRVGYPESPFYIHFISVFHPSIGIDK